MADTPEGPSSGRDARKQAKADLAAAKARSKAERPMWKKPWAWAVGLVGVAIVASVAGGGGGDDGGGGGSDDAAETTGIGSPAADGKFTFTVNDFECGVKKVGTGPFAEKAQGEFCVAELTVENTGDEAQLMDASSQYLYVGDKEYSADSEVVLSDKRAEAFFLEDINPGNTVDGIVVWDVPEGAQPDRLELHDSPFSGGVEVRL